MKGAISELLHDENLFRYRDFSEQNVEALVNDELFFSTPIFFNDPYDCLPFANSRIIMGEIIGNIQYGMNSYLEKLDTIDFYSANYFKTFWSKEESKNKILKRHQNIVFSALDSLRLLLRKNTKIISFSKKFDSMLMWSHYADNHKGFIAVYKKEDLLSSPRFDKNYNEIKNKILLEKVNYVKKQIDMTEEMKEYIRHEMLPNMGDIGKVDSRFSVRNLRTVLLEKAEEWAYEEEWRSIPRVPKIETESPLNYIRCKPSALILGSYCQGNNRERLVKICFEKHIKVYGIYLNELNPCFKLDVGKEGQLEIASIKYPYSYTGV